jgi:hypothetical protein
MEKHISFILPALPIWLYPVFEKISTPVFSQIFNEARQCLTNWQYRNGRGMDLCIVKFCEKYFFPLINYRNPNFPFHYRLTVENCLGNFGNFLFFQVIYHRNIIYPSNYHLFCCILVDWSSTVYYQKQQFLNSPLAI